MFRFPNPFQVQPQQRLRCPYPPHNNQFLNELKEYHLPKISSRISKTNLDPEYCKIYNDLLLFLSIADDPIKCANAIDEFAKKYLVLPQIWNFRKRLFDALKNKMNVFPGYYTEDSILKRAKLDFYSINLRGEKSTLQWSSQGYYRVNISNDNRYCGYLWQEGFTKKYREGTIIFNLKSTKTLLTFPHQNLQTILNFYQIYGDQVLPQSIYIKCKKSIKDMEKIKQSSKTMRELFVALIETNDNQFIIENIEIFILTYPCCKWLWKSYLHFLRHRYPRVYLEVFYKYIRFFISDDKMKKLFIQEQLRIYFEIDYENARTLESFLIVPVAPPESFENPPISNKNPFNEYISQKFSLPRPIINYILNSATINPRMLRTLFESCKHLFIIQKTPICYNLIKKEKKSTTKNNIQGQSLTISSIKKLPSKFQRLLIVNSISIYSSKRSKFLLSTLIPRIRRCDARFIYLWHQSLSWQEFQFIANPEIVEIFYFTHGKITNSNGDLATFVEIMELLPMARKLLLSGLKATKTTSSELVSVTFKNKLEYFSIGNVTDHFAFNDFEEFVKKNAAPDNPQFMIKFQSGIPPSILTNFRKLIIQTNLKKSFLKARFLFFLSK